MGSRPVLSRFLAPRLDRAMRQTAVSSAVCISGVDAPDANHEGEALSGRPNNMAWRDWRYLREMRAGPRLRRSPAMGRPHTKMMIVQTNATACSLMIAAALTHAVL